MLIQHIYIKNIEAVYNNNKEYKFFIIKKFINPLPINMFRKFLIFLSATLLTLSCNDLDPKPVLSKYHEEDMELNDKFFNKACGKWYNEKENDKLKAYESLELTSDKRCVYTLKTCSRKIVKINGVDTYTDWETVYDETEEGTWELKYSDMTGSAMPYLYMTVRNDNGYLISSGYHLFKGADDTTLNVTMTVFDSFTRGDKEPEF